MHFKNFLKGKTTNERFAKNATASAGSVVSEDTESVLTSHARESLVES